MIHSNVSIDSSRKELFTLGSIRKRSKNSWLITISNGFVIDPETKKKTRSQQYYTVVGTKEEAKRKMNELEYALYHGEYVEPTKITFGEWLDEWLKTIVSSGKRRPRTIETYNSVIKNHVKPALGHIPLQKLQAIQIQSYYNSSKLSSTTKEQHHTIIHSALEAARKLGYLNRNVASLVPDKPHKPDSPEEVIQNCWTADEARKFLEAAKKTSLQTYTFYRLALETGMRKGELCGLKWSDVNFPGSCIVVTRTLIKPGSEPVFGPPKNGQARTVRLAKETILLLRRHKTHQDKIKLERRPEYNDLDLVFAKNWEDIRKHGDSLGDPIQMNNIGQRQFADLIDEAKVKTITFHGMRHTCATLALQAGTQPHVVQQMLGHKRIEITLGIYGHVLPDMKDEAAEKLSAILTK